MRRPSFPDSSSCREAFLDNVHPNAMSKILPTQSRIGVSTADDQLPATLRVVNSGSGTTGTHSIYDQMCELKYDSVHFRLVCNFQSELSSVDKSKRQALESWHVTTTQCVLSSTRKKRCSVQEIVGKLSQAVVDTLSEVEFITDSPMDVVFPEIMAHVPSVKVVGTYRSPKAWAKRRVKTHTTQLICRPELWNDPLVLHPFDVVGCLQRNSGGFATDSLMTLFEYINGVNFTTFKQSTELERSEYLRQYGNDISMVEAAYQAMNTVNRDLAVAAHADFLPICLWDLPKRDNGALRKILADFMDEKTSSVTNGTPRYLAEVVNSLTDDLVVDSNTYTFSGSYSGRIEQFCILPMLLIVFVGFSTALRWRKYQ